MCPGSVGPVLVTAVWTVVLCFGIFMRVTFKHGSTLPFRRYFWMSFVFLTLFLPDPFSFARCSDHSSVFLQSVIKMPTEQD